jgi:hypothetical protein
MEEIIFCDDENPNMIPVIQWLFVWISFPIIILERVKLELPSTNEFQRIEGSVICSWYRFVCDLFNDAGSNSD